MKSTGNSAGKKKRPIRVAVIGARGVSTPFSGIERQCEEMYARMVSEGYEVCVYSREPYVSRKLQFHRGIRQKHLPSPNHKHLEAFVHSFLATCHAMLSDADILHFYTQGPSLFTVLPRLLTPWKKIVFTCQGLDWRRAKWGRFASTIIRTGEWCSAYFPHVRTGVSRADALYYRRRYGKPLIRIPNGTSVWDLSEADEIKAKFGLEAKQYIIFVGRLVPEKAIEDIIQAYKRIDTPIRLVITGDSSATSGYVKMLKELAADDPRICFTSFAYGNLLNELFTNALAYVSASRLEGLPLTLLEALSHRLPAVLSSIPVHREVLKGAPADKPCGRLFQTGNVAALEAVLREVLALPADTLDSWGQNARDYALTQYSWDTITRQYQQIYEEMLHT